MNEINDVAINNGNINNGYVNNSFLYRCDVDVNGYFRPLEEHLRDLLQHIHSKADLHQFYQLNKN